MSGIRAVAEVLREHIPNNHLSVCNVAVCGQTRLGQIGGTQIYAGMIPLIHTDAVSIALTELPGGPADPRQEYNTAYDNPAYTLHILGEDLVKVDRVARDIRAGADRTAHLSTQYGTINTLAVGPPRRIVRSDRPRYEVQMEVRAEIIRSKANKHPSICNAAVCGYTRLGSVMKVQSTTYRGR